MANAWKHDRAKTAIDARIKDVENVTVVDYTRTTSLQSIPTNKAYRLDGVHLYIDIVNFEEMSGRRRPKEKLPTSARSGS